MNRSVIKIAFTGMVVALSTLAAAQVDSAAEALHAFLTARSEAGQFSGSVLVAQGNSVLLAEGYGYANREHDVPNTPQTKFRIGDLTKQFTAAAILKLQEQGLLDVHDPVSTYLPDYPGGDGMTLHHLLTHTSGVADYTRLSDYYLLARQDRRLRTPGIVELFAGQRSFEPGLMHVYNKSNYVLLSHVIEVVSEKPYARFIQEELLEPLGLTNTGYDSSAEVLPKRASGYLRTGRNYQHASFLNMHLLSGAGGLYSTVEDLYGWLHALHSGEVLSTESVEAMYAQQVEAGTARGSTLHYGYGLLRITAPDTNFVGHWGEIDGFSSNFTRDLDRDLLVVVLSNVQGVDLVPIAVGLLEIAAAND